MDCPICHSPFNDSKRLPMIIPCGHSICAQCLNSIYTSSTIFCPLDKVLLPAQDSIRQNYFLVKTIQQILPKEESFTCCNGHSLEDYSSVTSKCRICKNINNLLWFCHPCKSGICDKCKTWINSSKPVSDPGIKCFKGHVLRMTQDPAKFYKRKGRFLCDGCRVETVGQSAHCRTCNVDVCVQCLRKMNELISASVGLRCICGRQVVWRIKEVCCECWFCGGGFLKCGSFACVECEKKFCVGCTYEKFVGNEPTRKKAEKCLVF